MNIPESFKVDDLEELHDFIEKFSFATLISYGGSEPCITHLPLLLDKKQGQFGSLMGHMAVQNPHLKEFTCDKSIVCIFQGPHSYISPSWYKSSIAVPTWNYAVVHAYGKPTIISHEQLSEDLTLLVDKYEKLAKSSYIIPEDYKQKLVNHIVGFRMDILRINGKFKLGQNRSQEDKNGMLEGLQSQKSYESLSLFHFLKEK